MSCATKGSNSCKLNSIWPQIAQWVKNLPAMQETLCSIPGSGRSTGEGIGYPLRYSGLKNSMDYPWSRKESDMTERLSLSGWKEVLSQLF